eukprot:915392_1
MMTLRQMAVAATKTEEQVVFCANAIAIAERPLNQWLDSVDPSDFVYAEGYRIFAYCRSKMYNFWCRETINDSKKQFVIEAKACVRVETAIRWNSDVTDTVYFPLFAFMQGNCVIYCMDDFDAADRDSVQICGDQ